MQRRLRAVVDAWFEAVVIGVLLVAAVGGWLTVDAHLTPETTTEERVVSAWELEGGYEYAATVRADNPVYPVGTTLRNQSVYLLSIAPALNGTVTVGYNATGDGSATVSVSMQLVTRSVMDRGEETRVVWEQRRTLRNRTVRSVSPGDRVVVPFEADVNRTVNRSRQAQSELGDPQGQIRLAVVTTVRVAGRINDRPVNVTRRYVLPIRPGRETYRVSPNSSTESFETSRTVQRRASPGPIGAVGGPVLFGVGLFAAVGLVRARLRGDLSLTPAERARIAFDRDRKAFDEWINEMRLPTEIQDRPRVEAGSLADLVDYAIDTNTGVIESPDGDRYSVIADGYWYVYEPPGQSVTGDGTGGSNASEDLLVDRFVAFVSRSEESTEESDEQSDGS